MSFYRLSMPIECAAVLISPAGGVLPVASNSLAPGRVEVVFYFHSHNSLIRLPYAKLPLTQHVDKIIEKLC